MLACLLILCLGSCRGYRLRQLYTRSHLLPGVDTASVLPARLQNGHWFVQTTIQGKSGWFLWDTGADMTVLDQTWAESLDLRRFAPWNVNDAQRRSRALPFCEIDTLALADRRFARVGAVLADLTALELCDLELAGIVGQTVIQRANWRIRFSDTTLALRPRPFAPDSGAKAVRLSLRRLSPYLSLQLGADSMACKLDYGSTGGIDLPLDEVSVRQLLGLFPARRYVGAGRGLYGWAEPDTGYLVWLDSIRLDTVGVAAVELDITLPTTAKIGTQVLSRYDAWLDFEHNLLWLKPLPQPLPTPQPTFGIYLRWTEAGFRVQALADLRETAGAGLRPSQSVATLQGRPASDFTSHCDFVAWRNALWESADTVRIGITPDSVASLTRRLPPARIYSPLQRLPATDE